MLVNSLTQVKITVLVENTAAGRGLLGEHGLSHGKHALRERIRKQLQKMVINSLLSV